MFCRICLCTVPDSETAHQLANHWLTERWAACVNEIPEVISRYRWKGEIHKDSEKLLIIKTTVEGAEKIRSDLKKSHPYDCPEWIEIEPAEIDHHYKNWIIESCQSNSAPSELPPKAS